MRVGVGGEALSGWSVHSVIGTGGVARVHSHRPRQKKMRIDLGHHRSMRSPAVSPRCAPISAFELPAGVVVTLLSGVAILARPDSALWTLLQPPPTPTAASESICRPDGWIVSLELAPPPSKRGVATRLLYGEKPEASSQRVLELRIGFESDGDDAAESEGPLRLLSDSRYFDENGRWTSAVLQTDGEPTQVLQYRLRTRAPLTLDDRETLPEATWLEFEARVEVDEAARRLAALTEGANGSGAIMSQGRIRLQVPSQLSLTLGVAEYRTVGTFRARPAPRREATAKPDTS